MREVAQPLRSLITTRKVGLARALSKLGYCSRSRAVELIRAGRVRLDGRTASDPESPVQLGRARIEVGGQSIVAEKKLYLMLNKPRGMVTTARDEKDRATVYDCLPTDVPWVAPVGRLDKASEGLLLMTNDSEWGARIAAPETHLDKIYHVQIATIAEETLLADLETGFKVGSGEILGVKHARLVRSGLQNSWLEIVLDEGKNRQIRRLLEHRKIEVVRLIRVAIGPLKLGDLAKGACRPLTTLERSALDRAMAVAAAKTPKIKDYPDSL